MARLGGRETHQLNGVHLDIQASRRRYRAEGIADSAVPQNRRTHQRGARDRRRRGLRRDGSAGSGQQSLPVVIVEGAAPRCALAGISWVGGETAQLSDIYQPGEYDLAGFAVGLVE